MNRNIKKNSYYVRNKIEVRLEMIIEWIYEKNEIRTRSVEFLCLNLFGLIIIE